MTKRTRRKPLTGLQGEGGTGRHEGDRTIAQLRIRSRTRQPITAWKETMQEEAANVFGQVTARPMPSANRWRQGLPPRSASDPWRMILEGALSKAGLLTARR